jgi:glutaredoxin
MTTMNEIVVYTQTNCPGCIAVKANLKRLNIGFTEVRVDLDDEARMFLIQQGHKSVPQVYVGGIHKPVNAKGEFV